MPLYGASAPHPGLATSRSKRRLVPGLSDLRRSRRCGQRAALLNENTCRNSRSEIGEPPGPVVDRSNPTSLCRWTNQHRDLTSPSLGCRPAPVRRAPFRAQVDTLTSARSLVNLNASVSEEAQCAVVCSVPF